jgi:hypothetical protein
LDYQDRADDAGASDLQRRVLVTSPVFTTRGYIEVWLEEMLVSRHNDETEAVESLLAHADGNPSETDRSYELRYPDKRVKVPGVRNPNSDHTPPTTPGNLSATALSPSTVQLTWVASTDVGTGVAGYQVWRNGTPLSPTTINTSFQDSGRTAGATYTYNVSAFDYAGNSSPLSISAQVTMPGVNNAPVWQDVPQQELTVGTFYQLDLASLVSDVDGQPLTVTHILGPMPEGLTYNPATKILSGIPVALLGTATVSWVAPTTNTDGSPLTGGDAIDHYRVSWYVDDVFVNSQIETASPATINDLAPGEYSFYVTAVAVDGEESDPVLVGTKTIT